MKERLKSIRKALGLTQEKLGKAIGVKQSTVGTWEIGTQTPPPSAILLICKEFNVRREWLENGSGEMFAPEPIEDDVARARRILGDLFNMLPDEKQDVLLKAMEEWVNNYNAKKDC